MAQLAIAMDLGTSGFRAQALDLSSGEVLSTAITLRHPLPGANVMDHLHFALEFGVETARDLMIRAVNQVIGQLRIDTEGVVRFAVCGNPAQLSLFQGMEFRDLAYSGTRKLESMGVVSPTRAAAIRVAAEFPGLDLPGECAVIIPPAVRHEIGADALALIIQSGMLNRGETAIAIDCGTNAEIALVHQGCVFTGSAAAGPALEGQHITCGTLAIPGAIADVELGARGCRLTVLNSLMQPVPGAVVDIGREVDAQEGDLTRVVGITGTGVIAAVDQALQAGCITLPRINTVDRRLHFGRDHFLTEADLTEAGKAIGAVRAGYFTLGVEAGISLDQVGTVYLAGASGTYVDALKARRLGLVPPGARTIWQVGNTSLAMARDLAIAPTQLEAMSALADKLRPAHCLFASSKTFARVFVLELSYWSEGLPMPKYRDLLARYRLPDLPPVTGTPQVFRMAQRDIEDLGRDGIEVLGDFGVSVALPVDGCVGCSVCVNECPPRALSIDLETKPPTINLAYASCAGVACRRCEGSCPEKVLELGAFFGAAKRPEPASESEQLGP